MSNRTIGTVLLVTGLSVMFYSALNIIFVFTRQWDPVSLFAFKGIIIDASQLTGTIPLLGKTGPRPMELLSPDILNILLNYTAHYFLIGFLVSIGGKVSKMGIDLMKEEKPRTP